MPNQTAVSAPNNSSGSTLADILVGMKVLTPARAEQVKMGEVQYGTTQEDVLRKQNMVTEAQLVQAKAALYNIPYQDLAVVPASPEALSILSQEVAERFNVFPLTVDKANKILTLAMADPMDLSAIQFIESKTGMRVKPVAVEARKLADTVTQRYATSLSQEVTDALKEVAPDKKTDPLGNMKISFIREEKISQIVSHILEFAVKSRSSDIHIEPQERSTRVRYRVDGILQEKLTIPKELHDALISRVKILCGMKIDEKRIPQDGRFNFKVGDEDTDLRVSTNNLG